MGPNRIVSLRGSGATEAISYFHSDHLGSSNVITNQAGNLISNCEYLPYGEFSTKTGANVTHYYFTGKELDDETGLMFYGARYYDPQIGRFIQPDTIVPHPYNPQSLNRYSYCYNNPINLTDPTGHWPKWKNIWQTVVSVITGVVSILCPVLAPVMWAVNMAISAYTAVQTGSILGFAGGIVGGAVFGALGKSLSLGLAGMMSAEFSKTFIGGALIGAVEFGMGGFGAGFGASVASGRSLSDSMRAGAIGAAMGAVTGAVIEGSYRAGWQNKLHGDSNKEFADAQAKTADQAMKQQQPKVLPEDAVGAANDYIGIISKSKVVSNSLTVAESVVSPTGVSEMVGRIVGSIGGFGIGAAAGAGGGPGGSVVLGIFGAHVGANSLGNFGKQFDYPGAGNLNDNEWEGYTGQR